MGSAATTAGTDPSSRCLININTLQCTCSPQASHFLSTWGQRGWEFAIGLIMLGKCQMVAARQGSAHQ